MNDLADVLMLLAAVAPRVSWQWIALTAAACLALLAWCDHEGAR